MNTKHIHAVRALHTSTFFQTINNKFSFVAADPLPMIKIHIYDMVREESPTHWLSVVGPILLQRSEQILTEGYTGCWAFAAIWASYLPWPWSENLLSCQAFFIYCIGIKIRIIRNYHKVSIHGKNRKMPSEMNGRTCFHYVMPSRHINHWSKTTQNGTFSSGS